MATVKKARHTYEEDGWSYSEMMEREVLPIYSHLSPALGERIYKARERFDFPDGENPEESTNFLLFCLFNRGDRLADHLSGLRLNDFQKRKTLYNWLYEIIDCLSLDWESEEFRKTAASVLNQRMDEYILELTKQALEEIEQKEGIEREEEIDRVLQLLESGRKRHGL